MPKLIIKTNYYKNPQSYHIDKYVRYIATRDGVEKQRGKKDNNPYTKAQQELMDKCIFTFTDVAELPELQAFLDEPTRYRASEFIDAVLDAHADDLADVPELMKYIANRPGVEKIGSHGLFSQTDEPINLEEAVKAVEDRKGNVWNHIISLKAEDAARLRYDNADSWKHLIRRNINELAQIHHMDPSDIQWYAAFHEKDHHPHIHMLVFSKSGNGYLSKKGMEKMRSVLTNDIFRGEMFRMFTNQTEIRNRLKNEVNDLLEETLRSESPFQMYYLALLGRLRKELDGCKGKKVYGYLPKKVKRFVDYTVAQFANDPSIKELYQKWCEVNRQKLSMYHDSLREEKVPLEDNGTFRSLKNAVIRAALAIDFTQLPTENYSNIGGLLSQLAKQIAHSCVKKLDALNRKTARREKKEQQKINEKKLAHGLKQGGASEKEEEEPTENFSLEPLLDTVDIILLNKKPTKLRRVHVPSEEKIQEDYEAYLREKYGDDYDEDLDEEEGQGWGQSM
ncbi:MobP3 family relaxase [Ruminococcus sp.]|uniref:MobP3 family relaxase n=1 Tax=Ruminococcus sp. TaxID=41978 RepID=UPI00386A6EED